MSEVVVLMTMKIMMIMTAIREEGGRSERGNNNYEAEKEWKENDRPCKARMTTRRLIMMKR